MDLDKLSEAINKALREVLGSAETKVSNVNKTVSQVIEEKKLYAFRDNEDGTLSSSEEMGVFKAAGERTRNSFRPTLEQFKKINGISLETQSETGGYSFTFQATNLGNRHDRGLQRFNNQALGLMAEYAIKNTIPFLVASKADCEDHTWKAINAKGFVYDAYVKDGGLFYDVYVADINANKDILDLVFTSTLNKLSVGFRMAYKDVMCDSCKNTSIVSEDCPHQPGEMDSKGNPVTMTITKVLDNFEISGVAVPCQAEAKIRNKSADQEGTKLASAGKIAELMNLKFNNVILQTASQIKSIDKIDNVTIEDNNLMTVDKVENPADELEVKSILDDAGDLPEDEDEDEELVSKSVVDSAVSDKAAEEDRLCSVAEKAVDKAVTAIVSQVKEFMPKEVDLTEVKSELAAARIELAQVLEQLKSLADLQEAVKAVQKSVEDSAKVATPTVLELLKDSKAADFGSSEVNEKLAAQGIVV